MIWEIRSCMLDKKQLLAARDAVHNIATWLKNLSTPYIGWKWDVQHMHVTSSLLGWTQQYVSVPYNRYKHEEVIHHIYTLSVYFVWAYFCKKNYNSWTYISIAHRLLVWAWSKIAGLFDWLGKLSERFN
jgi:hypothetical protein